MSKQKQPTFEEFLAAKVASDYGKLGYSQVQDVKQVKQDYLKEYPEPVTVTKKEEAKPVDKK